MTTNGTNPGMSVEDYENMAVQKSNVAKRVAAGAAVFVGGAAVAGGAAYAANQNDNQTDETPLTEQDIVNGAGVGETYKQETEETTQEHIVYVEKPQPQPQHNDNTSEDETSITWDNTTDYYVDGEKQGSIEEGTIDGHKFALVDTTGDNHANYLAIDMNDNGQFEDDEIIAYTPEDHVHMGHDTAHTTEKHYESNGEEDVYYSEGSHGQNINDIAENNNGKSDDMIHNNFEDEKTGEEYSGDYAENNPDYNPDADVDYSEHNDNYLAENDKYDDDENDMEYTAGLNIDDQDDEKLGYDIEVENNDNELAYGSVDDVEDTNDNELAYGSVDDVVEDDDNDMAYEEPADEEPDSYDSMTGGDEFLG